MSLFLCAQWISTLQEDILAWPGTSVYELLSHLCWQPLRADGFLLWRLAFHNYSCVSVVRPNYLTYSLKIESSRKVLAAQRGRLHISQNAGAEPGGRARSYTQKS